MCLIRLYESMIGLKTQRGTLPANLQQHAAVNGDIEMGREEETLVSCSVVLLF